MCLMCLNPLDIASDVMMSSTDQQSSLAGLILAVQSFVRDWAPLVAGKIEGEVEHEGLTYMKVAGVDLDKAKMLSNAADSLRATIVEKYGKDIGSCGLTLILMEVVSPIMTFAYSGFRKDFHKKLDELHVKKYGASYHQEEIMKLKSDDILKAMGIKLNDDENESKS